MMVRNGGFYRDDDPPTPHPSNTAGLATLVVLVSAVGAAIVLIVRGLLLTAGQ